MESTAPLKKQAYQAILERLLRGVYSPGETIDRRRMAEDLAMSVAPVHEAMNQLEWEGLLVSLPRRGTQIRPVKPEDVYGHLVLREALECQIARMVHGEQARRHQTALLTLAERADLRDSDTVQHCANEVRFHQGLAALACCPALDQQYERIMHVGVFYRVSLMLPFSPVVVYSHVSLLQVLMDDDRDAAIRAVHEHIWAGKPDWLIDLTRCGEVSTDHITGRDG